MDLISGGNPASLHLLTSAWQRILTAHRPSTNRAQKTHFRTFLAFLLFYDLPISLEVHNVLVFLEFLTKNSISHKVVKNYLSSISSLASFYNLDPSGLSDPAILRFIRSMSINSYFRPTPRGVFDIRTIYDISRSCDTLHDPHLLRVIFLVAFYAFLRMSNIAPHSSRQFSASVHFLRQDVIFAPPGAHLVLKWTKTLQDSTASHIVQIPYVENLLLCPVRALKALLRSRPLPPQAPLFANIFHPFSQIIDTHIRDALKSVLSTLNISPLGCGFHTFRRSGATLAFDNNIPLQNIMAHGLWRSSAFGLTYKMLPRRPPSFPLPLPLSSPLLSSLAWGF